MGIEVTAGARMGCHTFAPSCCCGGRGNAEARVGDSPFAPGGSCAERPPNSFPRPWERQGGPLTPRAPRRQYRTPPIDQRRAFVGRSIEARCLTRGPGALGIWRDNLDAANGATKLLKIPIVCQDDPTCFARLRGQQRVVLAARTEPRRPRLREEDTDASPRSHGGRHDSTSAIERRQNRFTEHSACLLASRTGG